MSFWPIWWIFFFFWQSKLFWKLIRNKILPYNPRFLLLGNLKLKQTTKYADLTANMLMAATQLIAENWKSETVPSLDYWLFKVRRVFVK